jgi:hypothetical protein
LQKWISLNPASIPAQTMFGVLFLLINLFYTLSTYLIVRANPYNEKLKRINLRHYRRYIPIVFILVGFVFTYTVYPQGVYISCILSTLYWLFMSVLAKSEIESSERFEALFDAIVAIILTVVVLEIPMVSGGSWEGRYRFRKW